MSNDLLFPQFLLNRGVLDVTEVRIFLERMLAAKVDVPVQALFHGVATRADLASLGALSGAEFRASAEREGVLTASQLYNLGERDLELDLEIPRTAHALNAKACPSKFLRLHLESPVGAFGLLLATDEFL